MVLTVENVKFVKVAPAFRLIRKPVMMNVTRPVVNARFAKTAVVFRLRMIPVVVMMTLVVVMMTLVVEAVMPVVAWRETN